MAQVIGIVKVEVGGQIQRSKIEASLDLGGRTRNPCVTYRLDGYTEKYEPCRLKFTLFVASGTDLIALGKTIGSQGSFIGDNGITYPLTGLTVEKPITVKGGSGEAEVEMFGDAVDTTIGI